MNRTNFGKRGGAGPTAGKHARIFTAVAPDGKTLTKRAFKVEGGGPFVMGLYTHEGVWHPVSVFAADDPRPSAMGLTTVTAHDISGGVGHPFTPADDPDFAPFDAPESNDEPCV